MKLQFKTQDFQTAAFNAVTDLTRNGEEKLYFILETNGTTNLFDLRTPEQLKIRCGKKHFEALENGVEMQTVKNWIEFKVQI